jgi:POTRA domain, FtsQ-type
MLWSKQKRKNRRASSDPVLRVRLRTRQARQVRLQLLLTCLSVAAGILLILFLTWRGGDWLLRRAVTENPAFAIRKIVVRTDGLLKVGQVRRWAGVRVGENLFALDLARVKRDLELVPLIKEADVERVLPDTLRLQVKEREPIARVYALQPRQNALGYRIVDYYLDAEGFVMDLAEARPGPKQAFPPGRLPILVGVSNTDLPPGRPTDSAQVRAALRFISRFAQSPMLGRVELSRIDPSTPGLLEVTTDRGSRITFAVNHLRRQLDRWRIVYDYGLSKGESINALDLSVTNNLPISWTEANAHPDPDPPQSNPLHLKSHV